jgi:hypothetical protein
MLATAPWLEGIQRDGFFLLPNVFQAERVDGMLTLLARVLETTHAVRSEKGSVYAARNVMHLWPEVTHIARRPPLPEMLTSVLGVDYGLVRVLYFDKPPDQTWALPWHKDLTIAVKDNRLASTHFRHPTRKAGIPHVEASREVLETMLFLRIHLDDVTLENGPLRVIPGSHHFGKPVTLGDVMPHDILAKRGDVLLIRPLVAHCSNQSHPETTRHRRILHLEFSGMRELPDGYEWHDYAR